jgi:hypothetical protein
MAPHQLRSAPVGDAREVPGTALLEQQRKEVNLEEDIAELVQQLGVVATVGGVGELVRLLNRVGHDRALVLLAIPGTFATKAPRNRVQARERLLDLPAARGHRTAYFFVVEVVVVVAEPAVAVPVDVVAGPPAVPPAVVVVAVFGAV